LSASRNSNYALFIGLRYSFSRKRNRFTSVIAVVSMLGMVIGVASLVTVLSVMNGFAGELRGRILSLVSHGYVEAVAGSVTDWASLGQQIEQHPQVLAVSPYITDKVILGGRHIQRGAVLTAIDPNSEVRVSGIADAMTQGTIHDLTELPFSVILGAALASSLGVVPGDQIEVTVPRLTVTPLGVFPRSKRLTVIGTFEIGAQADAYQAYVSLQSGQRLLGAKGQVDGLQVKTRELFSAPQTMAEIAAGLPPQYKVKDWSETQGSLFRAVKMEKIMVSLLLLSVVAVAAFNIVSTLVMSVAEKRRDVAVLRTMGARAGGIPLTLFIEDLLGVKLFDPAVYFISELPSRLQWTDVATVAIASLLLSILATLYPAWRASQVAPAEVLRYE
jgi:lipoprotein-releasing system permease protein